MSCGGEAQFFRLLDGLVGWNEATCQNLTGLACDDTTGLRLAQVTLGQKSKCIDDDPYISAADILNYIPPAKLAHGCGRCDWFLISGSLLLHHNCCAPGWNPVWSHVFDHHLLQGGVAIAVGGRHVAVSDQKAKRIWLWENDGEHLIASINTEHLSGIPECQLGLTTNHIVEVGPLAFTPWGELLVADTKKNSIFRFGLSGELYGQLTIELPSKKLTGEIRRLAVSNNCSIWVVKGVNESSLQLWRASRDDKTFQRAAVADLAQAFKPTGLCAANEEGFCLSECGAQGFEVSSCFLWNGEPSETPIESPFPPARWKQGQLLTGAIDSGIPRCTWHRVRLEADIPSGTTIEVAVATDEDTAASEKGAANQEIGWTDFSAGVPHHLDWQVAPPGSDDFLINQPPGRLLYVRLRLRGNGTATPIVRRMRLDFPRVTSLDLLPPVYRDNPEAEDFTERFLALFDASIADLDRAIERSPALLDPEGVPDSVLPWLAGFLDLAFDPSWSPDLRRKILRALPNLYRRRGTISGLSDTIKLIFGVDVAIQELATERNWGAVGATSSRAQLRNAIQLGSSRLFGKSRSRFRLNTSALSTAPLRSYGNPDHDPLLAQAFRLRVLVPPVASPEVRRRLEQLIMNQKPAHTVATLRFGGEGFILGARSAIGIDTIIAPVPRPVLGSTGNVRLNRMSVLWHGVHGACKGLRLGETSIVGAKTIAA
jgi:phage tail-like protein